MEPLPEHEQHDETKQSTSNVLLGSGLAIGALGAGAALISGAVCPLCVVMAPSLIGGGVVMKLIEKCKKEKL